MTDGTIGAPRLVVVTGPPGAGKTTVARLLAGRAGATSVCIESDWFWTTIVNGGVEPWLPGADGQNRTMVRVVGAAAAAVHDGGYAIVVEGIIGPWMLDELVASLGADRVVDYVVLLPELDACLHRATTRPSTPRVSGHPPLTDPEPIRQLWQQFSDRDDVARHVIDSTDLDAARTVDLVARDLVAGRFTLER